MSMAHNPSTTDPAAPLGRRVAACAVDGLIGGLVLFILLGGMPALWIVFLLGPYWGWDVVGPTLEDVDEVVFYAFFALWVVGTVLSTLWLIGHGLLRDSLKGGQSWGKRLFGLRVIDAETGLPCGRKASAIRNLPGLATVLLAAPAGLLLPVCGWLPLLLEPLAVVVDRQRLRIGDRWARTRVVTAGR